MHLSNQDGVVNIGRGEPVYKVLPLFDTLEAFQDPGSEHRPSGVLLVTACEHCGARLEMPGPTKLLLHPTWAQTMRDPAMDAFTAAHEDCARELPPTPDLAALIELANKMLQNEEITDYQIEPFWAVLTRRPERPDLPALQFSPAGRPFADDAQERAVTMMATAAFLRTKRQQQLDATTPLTEPAFAAFMCLTWMVAPPAGSITEQEAMHLRPSSHPDRVEAVMFQYVTDTHGWLLIYPVTRAEPGNDKSPGTISEPSQVLPLGLSPALDGILHLRAPSPAAA